MTVDLERDLTRLFEAQAERLTVPAVPADRVSAATFADRRGGSAGRAGWVLAAAAVVVVFVVGGALLFRAGDEPIEVGPAVDDPTESAPVDDQPVAFTFETSTVRLWAETIEVQTAGKSFSPNDTVEVSSDPGTRNEYTTLELTWFEHGVEMRIYLYFASDGVDWWVDEVRTYDGNDPGEWLIVDDEEHYRSFLGRPFRGKAVSVGALTMTGVELEGFLAPKACAVSSNYGLEPSAHAIVGEVGDGFGYGLGVVLYDATNCTPAPQAPVEVTLISTDESVVIVRPAVPEATDDGYRVDLDYVGPGTATVRIEARDRDTGELWHSVEVPVTLN